MLRWLTILLLLLASGCSLLPNRYVVPVVHNPFPQLQKIAIVPFFNQTDEPTVDGRQFAMAYFEELQRIPGFEVTPIGVVETAIRQYRVQLNDLHSPEDVRRLAQLLNVDAVVIGAVTDFTEYYPPRCALRVEWYAANACLHPAPPGFGMPWGTPDEANISESVRFDAEMAMSRTFLEAHTPTPRVTAMPGEGNAGNASEATPGSEGSGSRNAGEGSGSRNPDAAESPPGQSIAHPVAVSTPTSSVGVTSATTASYPITDRAGGAIDGHGQQPPCRLNRDPVLRHTRIYNGNDADFTAKLTNYMAFRDELRSGGVRGYLQRKDDFIRFCCFLHVTEMIDARGGGDESRVVWLHPLDR